MSERLVYVMGPSGAGKDSVLDWLRCELPASSPVHWARRTITRPAQVGSEQHEPVNHGSFLELLDAGAFAMHWDANGLRYGIRHEQLAPTCEGRWVLVNGSRGYLHDVRRSHPGLWPVHITADPETLWNRLVARGRDTPAQVRERVNRAAAFPLPEGAVEIRNDGALEDAGRALLEALRRLPGWPAS